MRINITYHQVRHAENMLTIYDQCEDHIKEIQDKIFAAHRVQKPNFLPQTSLTFISSGCNIILCTRALYAINSVR